MQKSAFITRLSAAACLAALSFPACAAAIETAAPAYQAALAQTDAAAKKPAAAKAPKPAAKAEAKTEAEDASGFSCTAIENIGKIDINAYGVHINAVRARAIPGIANGFNLFEVSYKVLNGNDRKIWVSGEFIFGYDGNLAGAGSASSGLSGVLPHETESIKGSVLSNDGIFKTKNICFRFTVEGQKDG